MNTNNSAQLFDEAKTYFPGGVSSPVRAFKSVIGPPLFIKKGKGCFIYDEDDNAFVDYCGSWGPLILGHADERVISAVSAALQNGTSFGTPTKYENILGKLILGNHRYIEKLRFVSSGTEAVMSAIRLARGYTKKNKIIKFEGCYHGHSDSLLVKAGSGLVTLGETSSLGIPPAFANETIVVALDDEEAIREAISKYKNEIACIIIEPVPANNGLLLQRKEYLQFLRTITQENNILLIFDEVISGFRIGFEGAAGYYNIHPDIITFGKIIGGGLPVGAYGARKEIMQYISPDGGVYQAGTLSGNPLSVSAGIAQLTACLSENFYTELERKTKLLANLVNKFTFENNISVNILFLGAIFWISFSDNCIIRRADQIEADKMEKFKYFHYELLRQGIYIGPSGYEVCFVSEAHTDAILTQTAEKICRVLHTIFDNQYVFKD
ncbi:MAG: glutamate-1-semialdehyde 2,1-aminomutase [Fimbriimonadaceae bacterium]|nr:glutamate-1-semialdehyde 2,1-aminomutase [Chitinophagales bacterium]